MKWLDAETATVGEVGGFYLLGYNHEWSDPKVRTGHFDAFDPARRFRLLGGPHMDIGPTHVVKLPAPPNVPLSETPTLEDDTFVDPAIATCSFALWPRKDGAMTNAVQLLVRPLDVRGDESGERPGEQFVMVTITREEVRKMLAALEEDMADCWRAAGAGGPQQ